MNQQKSKKPLHSYVKYSNLAFQILGIFLIGVFGGYKLDTFLNFKLPVFTILFSLIAIALVIYISIKDFINKK